MTELKSEVWATTFLQSPQKPFTDSKIDKTLSKLNELGLEIPCLSSGCALKI
ncbi:MAG: hypothetical protein L6V93_10915 [Clostridiales bacterium]|nr:MAG: hypothetical protein L6V93_10915 [Clostridiales bacterium]